MQQLNGRTKVLRGVAPNRRIYCLVNLNDEIFVACLINLLFVVIAWKQRGYAHNASAWQYQNIRNTTAAWFRLLATHISWVCSSDGRLVNSLRLLIHLWTAVIVVACNVRSCTIVRSISTNYIQQSCVIRVRTSTKNEVLQSPHRTVLSVLTRPIQYCEWICHNEFA